MQDIDEYYTALSKALQLKNLGAFTEQEFSLEKERLRRLFGGNGRKSDPSAHGNRAPTITTATITCPQGSESAPNEVQPEFGRKRKRVQDSEVLTNKSPTLELVDRNSGYGVDDSLDQLEGNDSVYYAMYIADDPTDNSESDYELSEEEELEDESDVEAEPGSLRLELEEQKQPDDVREGDANTDSELTIEQLQNILKESWQSGSRAKFTLDFKRACVRRVQGMRPDYRGRTGIRQLVRELIPPDNARRRESLRIQITKWRQEARVNPAAFAADIRRGRGRIISSDADEMERRLFEWILNLRQRRIRVTRTMVLKQALLENPQFYDGCTTPKALHQAQWWYYRFLRRQNLVRRRVTSTGQKLPPGWERLARSNLEKIHSTIRTNKVPVRSHLLDL